MLLDKSISALADQTLLVSQDRSLTPVLVFPDFLRFRSEFFTELAQRVVFAGKFQRVRFDWLVSESLMSSHLRSRIQFWSTRRHVAKLNQSLQRSHETATIELASQISRPANDRCFAIGISQGRVEIPDWSTPILAKLSAAS